MRWKKWLKTAMLNQLRITDWPAHVEPPGPTFNIKKIGASLIADVVRGYIDSKENGAVGVSIPKIVRWTAGEFPSLSAVG